MTTIKRLESMRKIVNNIIELFTHIKTNSGRLVALTAVWLFKKNQRHSTPDICCFHLEKHASSGKNHRPTGEATFTKWKRNIIAFFFIVCTRGTRFMFIDSERVYLICNAKFCISSSKFCMSLPNNVFNNAINTLIYFQKNLDFPKNFIPYPHHHNFPRNNIHC